MAEEYDHAFASYTDARKRFQELKMARGYLPVVALTEGSEVLVSLASITFFLALKRKRGHQIWQVWQIQGQDDNSLPT